MSTPDSVPFIGVDVGFTRLAAVRILGDTAEVRSWSRHPAFGSTAKNRLTAVLSAVNSMFDDPFTGNTQVYVEQPIQGRSLNVQTTIKLSGVWGAVVSRCLSTGADDVTSVTPAAWKQQLLGSGAADKAEIGLWLHDHHRWLFDKCPRGGQDEIDAACIALYGREVHGMV